MQAKDSNAARHTQMSHSLKSVRHLLIDKPTLKSIERETAAQQTLLAAIRNLLPADLAAHCVAARLAGDRLVLHSDSPVWASRLRFLSNELRSLLQQDCPSLRDIKIRLFPASPNRERHRNPPHYSHAAAADVTETARHTEDPDLRDALERLARALVPKR